METPSTGSQTPPRALDRNSDATSGAAAPDGTWPDGTWADGVLMADLPTQLVVTDPAMVPEIRDLFGPMPHHAGPAQVRVVVRAEPVARPDRVPDEQYGELSLWRDGDRLVVDSGAGLRGHVTPSGAVIGGSMGDGVAGARELRRIVHHVVAHILSLSGRLVVHGAAIGRGGRAILLLGASGQGKSTSAYLASVAGWSLLSDDLVVVRRAAGNGNGNGNGDGSGSGSGSGGGDAVRAIGVHRAIAVPPEVAGAAATAIPRDLRSRRRPAVALDAREHDVAAVVLLKHGTGAGAVRPADPVQIAQMITGSAPAAGNLTVAGEALLTAARLASGPCFTLETAATAEARLAGTAALFDEVARAAGMGEG